MDEQRRAMRQSILNRFFDKFKPPRSKLAVKALEAFQRRDWETAVQLYTHVKSLGATMDDVVTLLREVQQHESREKMTALSHTFIREKQRPLTREEKKHARAQAQKARIRRRKK